LITVASPGHGKGRAAWAGLGFRRPRVRDLLIAVGLSGAVSSASFAIAAAIGVVDIPALSPSELGKLLVRAVIMTAVFTPVFLCEEVGWRGYLLPRLATMTNGRLAAVATGAIHAVFHLPLLLITTSYQSAGNRMIIVPTVMITITAGGVAYAWSRWSSGSIWPPSAMHAAFNQAIGRWSSIVVATSAAALAYTTTETGLVTVCLMIILSWYLLLRRRAVFETGVREAREALAANIVPRQTTAAETL
jgi:membrane protease YdiL (CAAX protease family)